MSVLELTEVRPDCYDDDPDYDYRDYWSGREYEHAAEELAIGRLIGRRHVVRAVDVGGGFGRLSVVLARYAHSVVLAEPSRHQLDLAARFLSNHRRIEIRQADAARLGLPDGSVDLVLLVRVLHHIPDPRPVFAEFARVLEPGGTVVLEFANSANALSRLRHLLRGRRISRAPQNPLATVAHPDWDIPFVNHHPRTVLAALTDAGFEVERVLSGSNLRSGVLKRLFPLPLLMLAEKVLQPLLARTWFGPSVWVRATRR